MMATTHSHDTLIALAMTAAERYPLIYPLPADERARITESLRRLRVNLLAGRVSPGSVPVPPRVTRTTVPDMPRDPGGGAGVLHRGEYRGVRTDAWAKHDKACPWTKSLWPLTVAGDLIECSCGVTSRLDGPIAGRCDGALWALERALVLDELAHERDRWVDMSARERRHATRRLERILKERGMPIPWRGQAPTESEWDTIRDRLCRDLREHIRSRESDGLARLAGFLK